MSDTPPSRPRVSVLHARIARDLETLMNTRSSLAQHPLLDPYPLARDSILGYGLPDFTGCSPGHPLERGRLQAALIQALRRFEPRLSQVRVDLAPPVPGHPLAIRIEGVLSRHPQQPRLQFQVDFDPWSGSCEVCQ